VKRVAGDIAIVVERGMTSSRPIGSFNRRASGPRVGATAAFSVNHSVEKGRGTTFLSPRGPLALRLNESIEWSARRR